MGAVDKGEPLRFAIPEGPAIPLELPARLESWDRHDHPSQVALRTWVAHVRERIDPLIDGLDGLLALRVDVGLPETVDPLWQRDLDNYLYPIARELPERVVSVWGTKTRRAHSSVRMVPALPASADSEDGWQAFGVEPTAPADANWKRAVRDAVATARELPAGPVGLEVTYTLGRQAQWPLIWKPTIDGLEPLLGRTYSNRDWNPQDGRIIRLGLHRTHVSRLGGRASALIRATPALTTWPELAWFNAMTPAQRSEHLARRKIRTPVEAADVQTTRSDMKILSNEPGVRVFIDDDDGYGRWLTGVSQGFVVNAPRSGGGDLLLHTARCYTISGVPTNGKTWTGPYIKACAMTTAALERWALANAGTRPRACRRCSPL